jgi:hemerythrin superfamily protein
MQNGHVNRMGLTLAAGAAVGVIAGVAALSGRKAVAEAAEAMTGDWIDSLQGEHLLILEVFDDLKATTSLQGVRRRKLLARLRTVIDKHAFAEESVLYPALAAIDPEAARRSVLEHAEVKTTLYTLETTAPDSRAFVQQLSRLSHAIEAHQREEEDEIFPRLRQSLTFEADTRLTALMHRAGAKLA